MFQLNEFQTPEKIMSFFDPAYKNFFEIVFKQNYVSFLTKFFFCSGYFIFTKDFFFNSSHFLLPIIMIMSLSIRKSNKNPRKQIMYKQSFGISMG